MNVTARDQSFDHPVILARTAAERRRYLPARQAVSLPGKQFQYVEPFVERRCMTAMVPDCAMRIRQRKQFRFVHLQYRSNTWA